MHDAGNRLQAIVRPAQGRCRPITAHDGQDGLRQPAVPVEDTASNARRRPHPGEAVSRRNRESSVVQQRCRHGGCRVQSERGDGGLHDGVSPELEAAWRLVLQEAPRPISGRGGEVSEPPQAGRASGGGVRTPHVEQPAAERHPGPPIRTVANSSAGRRASVSRPACASSSAAAGGSARRRRACCHGNPKPRAPVRPGSARCGVCARP